MDALSEDFARAVVDTQMTVLPHEDKTDQHPRDSDEVAGLKNSLRQAVHDETVRPKMQCLMMDPSFSMVTMQGEDSGIEWETSPSRCTSPWASESGYPTDFGSPVSMRPLTPGAAPAGRIIIVMDEELMSRRNKTKDQKSKADRKREPIEESDGTIGRPELVEVSLPNVKAERRGSEDDVALLAEDQEQQLFCLVSEGSEILNIVVPPKLSTVDEEESIVMADNLSYLEVSNTKHTEETLDVFDSTGQLPSITQAHKGLSAGVNVQLQSLQPSAMDPPGAPVARHPGRELTADVDYFEQFTLVDAQAPGSPGVMAEQQQGLDAEGDNGAHANKSHNPKYTSTPAVVHERSAEAIGEEETTSENLDEVFYGGTENQAIKKPELTESVFHRSPLKKSGSALFGSQEDILTPIYLPEGPPKIIDPILLEEPKAMAFLYSDLYEEALGNRIQEEDQKSVNSEKSFHSRYSDREDRGYLEKYVLKYETPVMEIEPAVHDKCPKEGVRVLSEDMYHLGNANSNPEKDDKCAVAEEVTDFLRSSGNSSPCDIEPFPPALQEEEDTLKSMNKSVPKQNVLQPSPCTDTEEVDEEIDPFSGSDHGFYLDSAGEVPSVLGTVNESLLRAKEADFVRTKPVAPPRRKVASAPKTSLDLTPLMPVDGSAEEQEDTGRKEQRTEEKETASPAETADEADGEETVRGCSEASPCLEALTTQATARAPETETVKEKYISDDANPTLAGRNEVVTHKEVICETESASIQTEPDITDIKLHASAGKEVKPESQEDSVTSSNRKDEGKVPPAPVPKVGGQCIIL